MSDTEALATAKQAIESMDVKQVATPNLPVAIFIQEGEDLYKWSTGDRELLKTGGLDVTLIDSLPVRIEILRQTQGDYLQYKNISSGDEKLWKEKSDAGFEIQGTLLHYMRFAYRNNPVLKSRVDEIADGSGFADMIQDLTSLALLGKNNTEPLKAVTMELTLLDQAQTLSGELGKLLAIHNETSGLDNALKLKRDKAYTYLKTAMEEIRECGRFVFWRTPDRVKGYASKYMRKRSSSKKTADIPAQVTK